MMGEDFKTVLPGHPDQSNASARTRAHRQRSGCGHRHDNSRAHGGGLLHHFDRNPAAKHEKPGGGGHSGPSQGTGELIERIMATDVFAQDQALPGPAKSGGVNGVGLTI